MGSTKACACTESSIWSQYMRPLWAVGTSRLNCEAVLSFDRFASATWISSALSIHKSVICSLPKKECTSWKLCTVGRMACKDDAKGGSKKSDDPGPPPGPGPPVPNPLGGGPPVGGATSVMGSSV